MSLDPRAEDFYRKALDEHPEGPGALGFDLGASQQVRFDLLKRCIDDLGLTWQDRWSLLDVGCGTGDLLYELMIDGNGDRLPRDYIGVDLMPEMIDRAKSRNLRTVDGGVTFLTGSVGQWFDPGGQHFDVSTALATFCLKPDFDDQMASLREVKDNIARMVAVTNRLVLVTCLSTWKTNIIGEEMVIDPTVLWSWARSMWPRVDLIHSYAPHDFALAIWMEEGEWWTEWRNQKK